jgi:hypothetical protein
MMILLPKAKIYIIFQILWLKFSVKKEDFEKNLSQIYCQIECWNIEIFYGEKFQILQ